MIDYLVVNTNETFVMIFLLYMIDYAYPSSIAKQTRLRIETTMTIP